MDFKEKATQLRELAALLEEAAENPDSENLGEIKVPKDPTVEDLRLAKRRMQEAVMRPWSCIYSFLLSYDGGHGRLFSHPIKSPSLYVYDNIGDMMDEIIEEVQAGGKDKSDREVSLFTSTLRVLLEEMPVEGWAQLLVENDHSQDQVHAMRKVGGWMKGSSLPEAEELFTIYQYAKDNQLASFTMLNQILLRPTAETVKNNKPFCRKNPTLASWMLSGLRDAALEALAFKSVEEQMEILKGLRQ